MKLILVLLIAGVVQAETFFITQTAGSTNCGADGTQTASAASFFNTSANWASPKVAGKIGPGDTVNICGTISTATINTTLLTFQGSGTAGVPVTLRWESNGLLQVVAGADVVIANTKHDIVIDGNGTNPSITATANGAGLANNLGGAGIQITGCTPNCEVKNTTITNIQVMTADATCGGTCPSGGNGIFAQNAAGALIHDNTIDQAFVCLDIPFSSGGTITGPQIYNNTLNHCNWLTYINPTSGNVQNTIIHDNHYMNMSNWDTQADSFHHDGVFLYSPGGIMSNTFIYNNVFDGVMSVPSQCNGGSCSTAWIFFNTNIQNTYIFNNIVINNGSVYVLECSNNDTGKPSSNAFFYGNVVENGGYNMTSITNVTVEDNIHIGFGSNTNVLTGSTGVLFDWNAYQNFASGETHSLNLANVNLDASFHPLPGSGVIGAGLNLNSVCTAQATPGLGALCSDKAGVARPVSAAWDIGAFQATSSITPGTLGPWTVTQVINQTMTCTGCAASTWSVTGTLPTGLSLGASTGIISGTIGGVASTYTPAISFSTSTNSYSITVNSAASVSTVSPLPNATQGSAYSQTLTIAGGTGASTCTITSGSLLGSSLVLDANCNLSGTAGTPGLYSFTVTPTDANNVTGTPKALQVTVNSSSAVGGHVRGGQGVVNGKVVVQ